MREFTNCSWISNLQSAEMELVNRCKLKRYHFHQKYMQLKSHRVHHLQYLQGLMMKATGLWVKVRSSVLATIFEPE